jgi:hypothetical protein
VHRDDWGVSTIYHVDDANGRVLRATERVQDCEAILDDNKRMQNGEKQVGDFRLTSQIPLIWIEKWLREEWERGNVGLKLADREFDGIILKKLRDPDYKWLRCN